MKYLASVVALCVWGLLTLFLAISIIGCFPLMIMAENKDGWFTIPEKLVKVFE